MSQAQNKSLSSPGLQKGLMVLESITCSEQPLSFGQLMEITQTPKSTLIRLLRVLRQEGWLMKDKSTYLPGPRLEAMLKLIDRWERLTQVAHPLMEYLSLDTGNTAALFGIKDQENWVLCKSIHPAAVTMRKVGHRQTYDWQSPWGWMTSYEMPEMERERLLSQSKISSELSSSTREAWESLDSKGWCFDDQVSIQYVCRLAVPVRDPHDQTLIGCLTLGGNPLTMPQDRIEAYAQLLMEKVNTISKQL